MRINEHLCHFKNPSQRSDVANHDIQFHGSINRDFWKISVLKNKIKSDLHRKIWESKLIDLINPTIYKRRGITYLIDNLNN